MSARKRTTLSFEEEEEEKAQDIILIQSSSAKISAPSDTVQPVKEVVSSVKTEIDKVKAELKKLKAANKEKAKAEIRAAEVPRVIESAPPANIKLSAFQEERQKYFFSKSKNLIIGKRQKLDQKETLEALARFKSALHSFEDNSTLPIRQKSFLKSQEFPVSSSERKNLDKANLEMDSSKQSCPLHNIVGCGSCKDMFIVSTTTSTEDSLIEKDPTWLAHRLNFVRQPGERDAKQDFAGLVVIDPRDRIQSFK